MTTKVVTRATCDGCGFTLEEDGATAAPLVGWATLALNTRYNERWENLLGDARELCPDCTKAMVDAFLMLSPEGAPA